MNRWIDGWLSTLRIRFSVPSFGKGECFRKNSRKATERTFRTHIGSLFVLRPVFSWCWSNSGVSEHLSVAVGPIGFTDTTRHG